MIFGLGNLPENVLHRNPNGTWGYVGSVDARLAYVRKDGSEATEEEFRKAQIVGPSIAGLKTRCWPTEEAALAFKASLQER